MEPHSTSADTLDALRIQAAAVSAQQAALTEEELRLQQRRLTLEKQETQLAAHLDDRRRRLSELQNELKIERAALERERAELLHGLQQEKDKAVRERQQLEQLRQRQKLRWRDHWRQREEELNAEREQVRQEAAALEQERLKFEAGRLKLNAELELRRREGQEERQELSLEQQHWDETLNLDLLERQRLESELAERAVAMTEAEEKLVQQQRQWEQGQEARRHELDGLERRIRQLRSQLPQREIVVMPAATPSHVAVEVNVPAALQRLAGDVADQRWRLLEQWRRLLEIRDHWDQEKADIAQALEMTALQFLEREQYLVIQERQLEERLAAARQQQEALAEQRQQLEGRRAQLTAQEAGWHSERAALLAEIQAREESVAALRQQLELVRQRRERRRRQEIDEVRAVRARCEDMRHQYVKLWQDNEKRQAALTQRERELSMQRLALERYRVESLSRLSNPAAAEKRVEKLTQRLAGRFSALEREAVKQRELLAAEAARLHERAEELSAWQDELDQRSQDVAHQEANEEALQLDHAVAERQCQREVRQLQLRRDYDERQLTTLRDEVERIARLLLEDAATEPLHRAA